MKGEADLHHAYLVVGKRELADNLVSTILLDLGVDRANNPDLFVYEEEVFGIGEARELNRRAQDKAFTNKKIFILTPERITREAQNALLKTLEEPYPDTHFFLLVSNEGVIIPTLFSRMRLLRTGSQAGESMDSIKSFLGLSIADRLLEVKKMVDKGILLPKFIDDLLAHLREEQKTSLKDVFSVRRYADDTSASPRLILEHIALTVDSRK